MQEQRGSAMRCSSYLFNVSVLQTLTQFVVRLRKTDRCQLSPANYFHMFWNCQSLNTFWSNIFETLSYVTGSRIVPNAVTAIFGVCPSPSPLSSSNKDVVAFTTLLARRLILLKWKSPHAPTHFQWVKDVLYFLNCEKIRFTGGGNQNKFAKVWNPFLMLKTSQTKLF